MNKMDTARPARVRGKCTKKGTAPQGDASEVVQFPPPTSPSPAQSDDPSSDGPAENQVQAARATAVPVSTLIDVVEDGTKCRFIVTRRGFGPLRLQRGDVWLFHFTVDDRWRDYYVLAATPSLTTNMRPIFPPSKTLSLRVDSGCLTGQIFLDQTCECREQLHRAIDLIQQRQGLLIAIPGQDGRGLGVDAKLGMLHLDRAGFDTVEAAHAITADGQVDVRTYAGGISVLKALGILPPRPIRLLTNNPLKVHAFRENGYVVEAVPLRIAATKYTQRHLDAKRTRLGHLL